MTSNISITVLKRTNLAWTNVAYLSRFAPSADDGNRRDIISHADLRFFTEIVAFKVSTHPLFHPLPPEHDSASSEWNYYE
uniref:BTB domain-containing protein n=1 Tax=Mesocestoides corti TaxID=53468 RepID=A0A5K3G6I3_MESCO